MKSGCSSNPPFHRQLGLMSYTLYPFTRQQGRGQDMGTLCLRQVPKTIESQTVTSVT